MRSGGAGRNRTEQNTDEEERNSRPAGGVRGPWADLTVWGVRFTPAAAGAGGGLSPSVLRVREARRRRLTLVYILAMSPMAWSSLSAKPSSTFCLHCGGS